MNIEYKVLDDDLTKEIASFCSGTIPWPAQIVSSGMISREVFLKNSQRILDFKIREDDVWVITPIRCGTTWVTEMAWLLLNDLDFEKSKEISYLERVGFLEIPNVKNFLDPDAFDRLCDLKPPRVMKTHLQKPHLPKELWTVKPKIIFMFRNPKDAAISCYHFYKLIFNYTGSLELILRNFVNDGVFSNPFWRLVLDFWELRSEPNVLFLTYEEMKQDTGRVVKRTADFLGVRYTEEQEAALLYHLDIANMKRNTSVNYLRRASLTDVGQEESMIRKGEASAWKEIMDPEMIRIFDEWTARNLEGSDFPRDNL